MALRQVGDGQTGHGRSGETCTCGAGPVPLSTTGLAARTGRITPGKDADVIPLRADDVTVFQ